MTREEYEECRRPLGAQLEADIATVRAGHAARVRSLKSLWHAAKAGAGNAAVPTALPAPPDAPGTTARPPGTTFHDLRDALPRLPEVFDKRAVQTMLNVLVRRDPAAHPREAREADQDARGDRR